MFKKIFAFFDSGGQSLIEVLIALVVASIVIGALSILTLTGTKNSQFAKNQHQATQFAQEGMELVRAIRDRDGKVFDLDTAAGKPFSEIWTTYWVKSTTADVVDGNVYFLLNPADQRDLRQPTLTYQGNSSAGSKETLGTVGKQVFHRQVIFKKDSESPRSLKIIIIVSWSDRSETHQSKIETILTPRL